MGTLDDEIRRHGKKAFDIDDVTLDKALESLEIDGFVQKDGDSYDITKQGVAVIDDMIDHGMKVNLVCLECRLVHAENIDGIIVRTTKAGFCRVCQGELMWEPVKGERLGK
jgi:DNA-binding PadR family transcriptional regulator